MLSYATVGSNKLKEAKQFYDELLGLVGMEALLEHPSGGRIYASPGLRGAQEVNNFAAYFRDLDGNKLCAISMGAE